MQDEFSSDEIEISAVFLARYMKVIQAGMEILDIADETERRAAIAINAPQAAKFLESHTRGEIETKTMILAISYGVASAVVEGFHILQGKQDQKL